MIAFMTARLAVLVLLGVHFATSSQHARAHERDGITAPYGSIPRHIMRKTFLGLQLLHLLPALTQLHQIILTLAILLFAKLIRWRLQAFWQKLLCERLLVVYGSQVCVLSLELGRGLLIHLPLGSVNLLVELHLVDELSNLRLAIPEQRRSLIRMGAQQLACLLLLHASRQLVQ